MIEAKQAGTAHIVIGSLPHEWQQVMSVWTTKFGAETEVERLEGLPEGHEDKLGAEDFWYDEKPILHHGGPL